MTVVMSATGFFEAEMSSDSFQLLGMAEMVMIPAIFAHRSKHGTPTFSILCSATGVVILSFMSFQEIIEFLINFLYGLRMLVMFAAFIKLHAKNPDLPRPYRIPVGTAGAAAMCVPPVALITTAGAFLVPVPPPPDSSHGSTTVPEDAADIEDVRAGLLADETADEGGSKVE
uniref:Amino acid permease/ SLC12A domain-containing protein n=1 Tax=Setaria italica TaxID=4555 RepID=K3XQH5_SETIT